MKLCQSKYCWLIWLAMGAALGGCNDPIEELKEVIKSGRKTIPIAVEMETAFLPDVDHFITFGVGETKDQWRTVAYFGERYTLTMYVDVDVDFADKTVVPVGKTKFIMSDAIRVTVLPDGRAQARFGESWNFTEEDWRKLVDSEFDWTKIGVVLNETPTPDFSTFVQQGRRDQLKIRLTDGRKNSSSD